ncbi:MAG: divalent-cation tolerance protein CutA [Synechococcaceae cyanobacterium RL_1_2]|nr:divalent-cation tolerance protein CutA [Synechococcaceae cyanobacterium RL_1_2]
MNNPEFLEVHVTFANGEEARTICRQLLSAKLIGCAQILPNIGSMYWWDGKIGTSEEVLVLLKARAVHYAAIEELILAHHSYDTPEIIAIAIEQGYQGYLDWLKGV